MMTRLMKMEMRKIKISKYILISIFLILFSLLFITISLVDSATDPGQSKDTFDNVFLMIEVLLSFIYIIFYGVLVAAMVIKEYNARTILIMFSYPVSRKKLMAAKLSIISIFIALSMFIGYLICCGYVVGADHFFDLLAENFVSSYMASWTVEAILTTIVCICVGLLTFSFGMVYKSVPGTIVCSIILIFIRQAALSSAYGYRENLIQTFIVVIITAICLIYCMNHKINETET